ncbi:hypothetical protein LZP69_15795 [Shewanella sp. AS1]|nr:hypothetical protein [Shewanella sp. AS1]
MKTCAIKVLFILILTGQFILTPAMGMPIALLSLLHNDSQISMTMPAMDAGMDTMRHEGALCSMTHQDVGTLAKLDCQSLCDSVGGGHCVAHFGSVCSGQLKLATVLYSSQYLRSDSLGVSPPLY